MNAYAIHNVTYYLSNIYYGCGTNPHVFMLIEQITAKCVRIYIYVYNAHNDPYSHSNVKIAILFLKEN